MKEMQEAELEVHGQVLNRILLLNLLLSVCLECLVSLLLLLELGLVVGYTLLEDFFILSTGDK